MFFEVTKLKLFSILSYIFPFGFINIYFVEDVDDEVLRFHLVQGFVLNLLYFLFIIFYLMVKLFVGSVPVVGYLANIVGMIFLGVVMYFTFRAILAVASEEVWHAPLVGFLVETLNK